MNTENRMRRAFPLILTKSERMLAVNTSLSGMADRRRQLLIVDDDAISRAILGNLIGESYDVAYAENGCEALAWLERASRTVSLVLLDLMMPVMDGVETLRRMKESEALRKIPVIVLTSEGEAEAETLRSGATDFITKPYKEEIVRARIARTIELAEDRQIIQTVETDGLTGLYSKDFFFEYAGALVEAHPGVQMDALVLDLDRFHLYNEMRGRDAGNRLLARVMKERGALVYFEPSKVVTNADLEAVRFSDIVKFSDENVPDVSFVDGFPDKVFIQTMGAKGVRYKFQGQPWEVLEALPLQNVVDTEGAGDCFTATFINALAESGLALSSIPKAITAAMANASRSVGYLGSKGFIREG